MADEPQEVPEMLLPNNKAVKVDGRLFYSEGDGSWNTIRLKREILHEFPALKDKIATIGYTMIVPKSKEGVKEVISEMKEAIPVLLFFRKETNVDE